MRILSYASTPHDASYCVIENGKIVLHNELERFTRIKHDGLFNNKPPFSDTIKNLIFKDFKIEDFDQFVSVWGWHADIGEEIFTETGKKIDYVGHHTCHASSVFYNSNFEKSIIFTFDGGGFENDWYNSTNCVFLGNENKIYPVYRGHTFNIGSIWTFFLQSVLDMGFACSPKGDESGTLMAMASFGDPSKYLSKINELRFENLWAWQESSNMKYTELITFFREEIQKSDENRFHIAAALQYTTEELMIHFVFSHLDTTPDTKQIKNICFSGGVSLNCVALGKISKILIEKGYNVFCDQAPNDSGLSIGAAKYTWYHILDNPRVQEHHTSYLGKTYTSSQVLDTLTNYENLTITQNIDVDKIVDLLTGSKIISLFNEGSESGKRALGNRSIIADPRFAYMKDLINLKVKHRKSYRPFAPSVLREEVPNWFEFDIDSPYMSFAVPVREEKRQFVPAILHNDNTARLQTVTSQDNGYYYDLIRMFFEKTGVPMILNTSFNNQEPIVETPKHAIDCFLNTQIDYLYFVKEKLLVSKSV